MQLVTFKIGRQMYGMDIMFVQEVIVPEKITGIPNIPNFIEGVIDLRGTVIPIVDMRKRFNTADPDPVGCVLITELAGGPASDIPVSRGTGTSLSGAMIGLRVDQVGRVIHAEDSGMRQAPEMLSGLGARFVSAIYEMTEKQGGGHILLFDVGKLFADGELMQLRETPGVGTS